ncbi:TPA: nucleotidyltransferase domain-containing protein [Candidatus Woesearchaeota archaeon]|nr:nucleotidyltransferase domain-containing protein [Candidatus Woesearchaeota archaeon]HIJ13922.1 nucleotidyltransferase domain-containing protein [Candidatus Woesearchaeota archaeon]
MIIPLFDLGLVKVLTVFSLAPGSRFSRDDIQKHTKMNNVMLDNALTMLINMKLLLKEKRMIMFNQEFIQILKLISDDHSKLKKIPLDAYFSILELQSYLVKIKSAETYLFGSYAKLIYKNDSDIDIAVISDKITSKEKKRISSIVQKMHQRYLKDVQVHYFTKDFYKNKKDPLVVDILKNGIKMI